MGVIFDQFLNIDAISKSIHFHIRNMKKIGICYRMMLDLPLFMHLIDVDEMIVIPESRRAHFDKIAGHITYYPGLKKNTLVQNSRYTHTITIANMYIPP